LLGRPVTLGNGGDRGNYLGGWPVYAEKDKGSRSETEKQQCGDETGSGRLLAGDYGRTFFVVLAHSNLVNN
jgi:hypothetical protein